MSHINESRHKWVMSRINESRHTWVMSHMDVTYDNASHVKCGWVMSHINESRHKWVMSHINESRHKWVMSHINESRHKWVMSHINESRHTWVMSHINESRHTWVMSHINESRHTWVMSHMDVTYDNTSHVKCGWVMSHIDESCHTVHKIFAYKPRLEWKETYKRDPWIRKETQTKIYQRDLSTWKMAYIYAKRPMNTQRDLWIHKRPTKETHKNSKGLRPISTKKIYQHGK